MEKEFELFVREKRYVQNVSENTIEFYKYAFKAFKKHLPVKELSDIASTDLIALVANMRQSGLSARNLGI